jgi:hypothetical protein
MLWSGEMSVYFIEAVGTNRVKIGYAGNPRERLCQLQPGSLGHPLRLLFSVPGNRETEAEYHHRYRHLRVSADSEWFYFDSKLKQLIDAVMMYDAETHDGLPVLRGILTNLTQKWFRNPDGKTESPQAHLQIMCPESDRPHRHGWRLHDGYDTLRHKRAHCDAGSRFREKGYYVGVINQPGIHCHEPGRPIIRPIRPQETSGLK